MCESVLRLDIIFIPSDRGSLFDENSVVVRDELKGGMFGLFIPLAYSMSVIDE